MIAFHASRLKVERAKEHISDLNREMAVYKRKDPYCIIEDRDSEPGQHLVRIVERVKPPKGWPVVIGDVLHNLHSGLDILACDILRAYGRSKVRDVYFPFSKGADTADAIIKRRKISETSPHIVNAFRALNAHKGGNRFLYAIHEMNIVDKHQLLITINQPAGITHPRILRPDGSILLESHPGTVLMLTSEDRILFRALTSQNLKFEYQRKVPFQVLFDIGSGELEPVIPALTQMTKLVSEIVEIFEGHVNNPRPTVFLSHQP